MKENKIDKIYNNTVFNFAFRNKVNSENAEKKFLEYYESDKPETTQEKEQVLEKVSIFNDFLNASKNQLNKKYKLNIINILNSILFLISGSVLLTSLLTGEKILIVIPVVLMLINILIGYIVKSKLKKQDLNNKMVSEALVEMRKYQNSVDIVNRESASRYIKEYRKENLTFANEFIYSSIESSIRSNIILKSLSKIRTITTALIFLYLMVTTFVKHDNLTVIFVYLIYTSIIVNILTNLFSMIAIILAKIRYNNIVKNI